MKNLGFVLLGAACFIFVIFGFTSFFTVNQKEVAVVTNFGAFSRIEGAGLHFKIPFAESYTIFHVATQQLEVEKSEVYTADNQGVNVTMLVQYDVPETDVKNLFERFPNYQQRMYTLANDKMKEVFGKMQVADIPSSRGQIEADIQKSISQESIRLYGLQTTAIQIIDLEYSQTFIDAINQMTRAKAEVTKAEQLRQQAIKDAERQQIAAKSEADAKILAAKGEAESLTVRSQAEAQATKVKGEAEAYAIKAQTDAIKSSPEIVQYEQAKRWNGQLPTTMLGANSNTMPILNLH